MSLSRAPPRNRSRSDKSAASFAAAAGAPCSLPLSSMCASRGCAASCCIARPCGVMRPPASSAPRRTSKSRAPASVAAGGASSQRSSSAAVPHAARSSASGTRVGDGDLGRRVRREAAVRALAPQPIADAGRRAARAARALLGRGARDALRLEPAHAGDGIEHAAPLEPGVDDDAHAVDRQARLRDVRREHDLAAARARRRERRVLLAGRELAVERQHVDVGAERELVAQPPLDAADLAGAGQEHEQVARRVRERALHGARDGRVDRLGAAGQRGQALADVVHVDGEHAPEAFDDGRAAEQAPRRARRRSSPTSRARAAPARGGAARRARTRGRRRRAGCARDTRRTAPRRRLRAPGRSAACA